MKSRITAISTPKPSTLLQRLELIAVALDEQQ